MGLALDFDRAIQARVVVPRLAISDQSVKIGSSYTEECEVQCAEFLVYIQVSHCPTFVVLLLVSCY